MIGAIRPYSGRVNSVCNPFVFVQIWRQSALLRARLYCSPRVISSGVEVAIYGGDGSGTAAARCADLVSAADYFELRAMETAKQSRLRECHKEDTSVTKMRMWPYRWPVEMAAGESEKAAGVLPDMGYLRLDLLI